MITVTEEITGIAPDVEASLSDVQQRVFASMIAGTNTVDLKGRYRRGEAESWQSCRRHRQLAKGGWMLLEIQTPEKLA